MREPSKEVRWVVAPRDVIRSFPGCEGIGTLACAIWFVSGICVVLATTPKDQTPQWLIDHEVDGHCAGKDHT